MRPLLLLCTTMAVIVLIGFAEAGGTLIKKEEIPKAIDTLKKGSSAARADAAEKLGHRGAVRVTDVKDALEPLRYAVKSDPDAKVRSAAAAALGRIGSEPEETVPVLMNALSDKATAVKMAAITALGQMGPEARAAAPELRKIAGNKKDKGLSKAAGMALKSIGGKTK